jgi:hypothetical protein
MNALILFSAVVASAQAQVLAGAGLPLAYNNLALNGYYGAAFPYAAPALAAPALAAPLQAPSSQFQAQDELGNINYGYANINSAKHEVGNAYGGVTGSYSYVDANGLPQRVDYIADELGFRVVASNLPVAKSVELVGPVDTGVAPLPVEDTEEVKAAKAEFNAAFEKEATRTKRQAVLPLAAAPLALPYAGLPYAYAAGVALPYNTISAPATAEAVLTKIQLNPGHAVAYRVD